MPDNRGTIPGHGPSQDILDLLLPAAEKQQQEEDQSFLKQHFCLAVPHVSDVEAWEAWFQERGVRVTGTVNWPKGGRSVYFADVDGNVGEIGSRGIWDHY